MIGIIVCGHGGFASGMTSALKLIAGMPEKFEYVDFVQEDSTADLEMHLKKAIGNLKMCEEGILIFTDVYSGSPYKISVDLSSKLKDMPRVIVLSGTNLGMLAETSMSRAMVKDLRTLADMAVAVGKQHAMRQDLPDEDVSE